MSARAWWSRTSPASSYCHSSVGGRERKLEREHAPPPHVTLRPDPSPVRLHHRPRDGEADPGATLASRSGLVNPIEPFEQERQVLGRDAGTRVLDADLTALSGPFRCDDDLAAGRGVSHGVVEEVEQDLMHALAVRPHRRDVLWDVHANVDEVIGAGDADLTGDLTHQRGDVERLAIERDVARLQS